MGSAGEPSTAASDADYRWAPNDPATSPGAPMGQLDGFIFPRTATGRSSILPPPPWHYSGDLLTIEEYRRLLSRVEVRDVG